MTEFDVFCLPFAGGNKYSYRIYQMNAPDFINIIPLEYPGRGARMKEPLIKDMNLLVNDMFLQVRKNMSKRPYAIYGHSMGGIVGYLVCRKIFQEKSTQFPVHLFITGTIGPSSEERGKKQRYLLSKKDFIAELRSMEGCPEEILQNEDLLNYYEPILRSDFEAAETFLHHRDVPIEIPMTVVTGTEEDMEQEDIELWQEESILPIDFKRLPGKHFFIFNNPDKIISMISQQLSLTSNF